MQSSTSTPDESTPKPVKAEDKPHERISKDSPKEAMKSAPKRKIPLKRILKIGILAVLIISLLATSGVLGYLYNKKYNEYKALTTEKARIEQALEDEKQKTAADYQAQIDGLEEEVENLTEENEGLTSENESLEQENATLEQGNTTLEQENTTLENSISAYQAKQTKITAYIDFLDYVYYVVGVHGGFGGLTETEYQTARSKAQATGDSNLVSAVDSAWNDTEVDQMIRFINVINAAQSGIKSNL